MSESNDVIVARFNGSVEAEVARAMLEGAGVPCHLAAVAEESHDLYVTTDDAPMAEAVLRPETVPAVAMSKAEKCPVCGARDSMAQGWVFWTMLVVLLAVLAPVAISFSHGILLGVATAEALLLAGVELSFKDYRCNRCGKHFRVQRGRRRVR
ncbi:MAG: hypothetical protein ABI718_05230 [Acidobacteriota bacterium]